MPEDVMGRKFEDKVVTPTAEVDFEDAEADLVDARKELTYPTVEEGKVRRAVLDGPQESDVLLVRGEPGNPMPFEGRFEGKVKMLGPDDDRGNTADMPKRTRRLRKERADRANRKR